jgi:hypothetical protein
VALVKAIAYFERHLDRLTLFCKIEGAKIDNNEMKVALKPIVRNPNYAYFHKLVDLNYTPPSTATKCLQQIVAERGVNAAYTPLR